jgi:LCP family protein required for cell wall assembly
VFWALFWLMFWTGGLVLGTALGYLHFASEGTVSRAVVAYITGETKPENAFPGKRKLTILVVGADENRDNRKRVVDTMARTDTILVAQVDFVNQRIHALSIPRDTLVRIPRHGWGKINSAHALGGPRLLVETVSNLLGNLQIDHVVIVSYKAFEEAIDALGGVTIEVEKRMVYHDNWGDLHVDLQPWRPAPQRQAGAGLCAVPTHRQRLPPHRAPAEVHARGQRAAQGTPCVDARATGAGGRAAPHPHHDGVRAAACARAVCPPAQRRANPHRDAACAQRARHCPARAARGGDPAHPRTRLLGHRHLLLRPMRQSGLTQLEKLAIAVAVIAVVAILIPLYRQLVDLKRTADCLSNLKDIATAINLYQLDYANTLPLAYYANPDGSPQTDAAGRPLTWVLCISSYMRRDLQRALQCPADPTGGSTVISHPRDADKTLRLSYGFYAPLSACASKTCPTLDSAC